MNNKPRIAENAGEFWKEIVRLTESGVVTDNYGLLYPVVRTFGDGDYEIRRDEIKRLYDGGYTYKNATTTECQLLDKIVATDTAQVELMTRWNGSGPNFSRRTVQVLHSPSGLSWKHHD